jgi:cytochrome P450
MTAQREDLLTPAWSRDTVESFDSPEVEAAYFDRDLGAWVLSRYADVLTAFHSRSLVRGSRGPGDVSLESEEAALVKAREEVRKPLSPVHVRAWGERLRVHADNFCEQLPIREPVDLIAAYGRPLCLRFAAMVTHTAQNIADDLEEHAKVVSASTADPENAALRAAAKEANATLHTHFRRGPELLRAPGFVGLSQTLLRIVGASWYALARYPDQWRLLHNSPESVDQAMEELLRYAGVVRMLSRTAIENFDLNGIPIRRGDRIILRVFAANHDSEHFCEPKELDCTRRDPGHFAFGAGAHACVAANLIRTAAMNMTLPLLSRFASVELVRPVEWHGGSAMRSPASLWGLLGCI